MKDTTLQDLIEYFQGILDDGGVIGTDFELTEVEIEIYEMTISSLKMLL